jgi:hypothetical protein
MDPINKDSPHFSYTTLSSKQQSIRLLTLLPANDTQDAIQCSIEAKEIGWKMKFEALSYTWGAPGDDCPRPIYLNGCPFTVSRNLDAALRALRQSSPRTLWVDALCINQKDNDEKSKQVAMMDIIYEKALQTVVWLGTVSSDSNLAMTTLARMKSKKELQNLSKLEDEAIGHLFSRPWFSRVWVVQEFSLAKNVMFHCGSMSFSWKPIEKLLDSLIHENNLLNRQQRESSKPDTEILDNLSQNQIWLRLLMDRKGILNEGYGNYKVNKSFRALVESHIHLEATVHHDRIYGLLALGKKRGVGLTKCPDIHYSDTSNSVNIAWAKWMIEESKNLDILFACQKTTHETGLPSWAPSWKARDESSLVPNFSSARLMFYASSKVLMVYDNHKQVKISSAKFAFSPDDQLLSLEGKQIAVLDSSYQFKTIEPEYYRKLIEFLPAGYISGEPQSVWQHWKEFDTRKSAIKFPMAAAWQIPHDYMAARRKTPARLEKLKRVVMTNRKQFIGRCEGLVPKEAQTGDILILFKGMETPFVLRPAGEKWIVIGECFIEGYMKGRKSIAGDSRTFVLC